MGLHGGVIFLTLTHNNNYFCVETTTAYRTLILTYFIIVICVCECVMNAPFLTIVLIWTSSLSITIYYY